jgi:glycosyltransferase involved in cell wall biosynthesis
VIARFAAAPRVPVLHLRQEHQGFRVTRLRNLATARARGEYIVFVDGDMLLHPSFMADHRAHARGGAWTQGVRLHLDAQASERALAAPGTLPAIGAAGLGLRRLYAWHAPGLSPFVSRAANAFVAVKSCNQGFWREDLLAVNGFNEEIVGWGFEDKELAARLAHYGCRRRTLLFGGIAWHLHHPPVSREHRDANAALLERTRQQRLVRCRRGLDAHLR